jgi:hypothetical protein
LLCVKHWFKELDDPQAAAFADTPIGQSLLKLDESQRKRLESLFNTAYGVVKAYTKRQLIIKGTFSGSFECTCNLQKENLNLLVRIKF